MSMWILCSTTQVSPELDGLGETTGSLAALRTFFLNQLQCWILRLLKISGDKNYPTSYTYCEGPLNHNG